MSNNRRTIFFVWLCLFPIYSQPVSLCMKSILDLIASDDLIFDVGAHVGEKSSTYIQNGAKVVCIEPQPDCFIKLQNRFSENSKVMLENVGLSSQVGHMDLYICSSSNTISTFSKEFQNKSRHSERGYKWDRLITVPVTTLDNLIDKYGVPQFCKIDVENFEFEVLKGLTNQIPFISIEFHVELYQNAILCLDYLESLGYKKFNFAAGECPNFVLSDWVSKQDLIKEMLNYSLQYYLAEKDPLWGDIYASCSGE